MRLATIGLATAAATLALAGTASADSISFIRGGDIWVASPDGAKEVQVTHSGIYSYQSQAEDGTFIALAGRRLHRIGRTGTVLADFSTPVSAEKVDDKTSYFMGPFDPEISPDGTKVAYSYLWQYIFNRPGCTGPNWLCQERHLYQGVGYSASDRMTGWDEPGFGRQSGWVHPSWMGNDQVMLSAPSEPLNLSVMFDRVGGDNNDIHDWFSDDNADSISDGEINRQGTAMAFVTSDREAPDPAAREPQRRLSFYRLTGPAPALPEACFALGYADGTFEGPTWSPAGDRIAVADRAEDETGRILVAPVPDITASCQQPPAPGKVVIADARHPDWGPAGVPSIPTAPEPPSTPATGPRKDDHASPSRSHTTRRLSLRGRRLARALRRGVVVRVHAPTAGRVSAHALRRGRVVATGSRTAARAGTVATRLRFNARARRALGGRRSVRLTVRIGFRSA
jgi:hypothetical protein